MRIIGLYAENFKRLRAIEISPDDNWVEITGKNGQGKTSVLDAITAALDGARSVPDKPIRTGEQEAKIKVILGDKGVAQFTVEKRFVEGKTPALIVRGADGARFNSPQELLNSFLGTLTLDPVAFMRQPDKQQFETLRGIVKIDVDIPALDRESSVVYEARRDTKRRVTDLEAQAAGVSVPVDAPTSPPDTQAIIARLAGADQHNAGVRESQNRLAAARASHLAAVADVTKLQEQVAAAQRRAEQIELAAKELAAMPVPDLVDTATVRIELEDAQRLARAYEARKRREDLAVRASAEIEAVTNMDRRLAELAKTKADALERAEMPIAGLGMGDGVVLYKGLPLTQASDAEQLMVSASIAAALNPELKVIRIRDGGVLDIDSRATLRKFAEDRDLQIWMERVEDSGEVGIVMTDGHIAGQVIETKDEANQTAPAAPAEGDTDGVLTAFITALGTKDADGLAALDADVKKYLSEHNRNDLLPRWANAKAEHQRRGHKRRK